MKTRREILKGLIVSIGGSSLLNACGGITRIVPSTSMRFYSDQELALVSHISDLIIPRTDTPGALDVKVPGFLDSLMAEWANQETKNNHHEELKELAHMLGEDFAALPPDASEQQLAEFDYEAFKGRPTSYSGYRSLKSLITQAYFASEEGALQEQKWVAVPGHWDPCVEIQ